MTGAWIAGGIVLAFLTICAMFAPANSHRTISAAGAHALTQGPINYGANPYRIGAYVYVMEDGEPSQHDWQGTFIGMADGMALVRDQDSHVVAHVNKDQLYGATR